MLRYASLLRLLSLLLLAKACGAPLHSADRETAPPLLLQIVQEAGTFSTFFENDLFARTDRDYTNGVRISWTSGDLSSYRDHNRFTALAADLVDLFPLFEQGGTQRNIGLALGQNMYTPPDITLAHFQPQERPYAGWLYVATSLHSMTDTRLDTVELNVGVVGPLALARQAQTFVHKQRDFDIPQGWQHQLRNEPAINLVWERKHLLLRQTLPESSLGMDSIVHYGTSLGNVFTYANFGMDLRFGWNLPRDFASATLRPAGDTQLPVGKSDLRLSGRHPFSLHGFIGVDARALARNIFLDGNTLSDSHRVSREPFVADLSAGVGFLYERWRLSYAHVLRTQEYQTQGRHHTFGAVHLSYSY